MCLLLFLLRQQSREVGTPFLLPSNANIENWKNNHETHSSLVALTSLFQKRSELSSCRGQSPSHERRRRIMPDGSLLFPEGGGELPPYANARNWPRPPSHFSTRSLTIIICCTRDRCRTVHYKWKTHQLRRYLFYSPLCCRV